MSYSNPTTTLALMPVLAQTTTSNGYSTSVAMLERNVTRADAWIDGKLSKRYSIPLNGANTSTGAVPPLVRTLSQELTMAWTYDSFFARDNQNTSEYADEKEKRVFDMLDQLQARKIDLVDTAGSLLAERDSSTKLTSTSAKYTPTFLEDSITSSRVDSSKIEDIQGSRG